MAPCSNTWEKKLKRGRGAADKRNMTDKNPQNGMEAEMFRIFRYNATFSTPEYVTADGHGYTLRLDKAATFPTLYAAAWTQRLHFPGHTITGAR